MLKMRTILITLILISEFTALSGQQSKSLIPDTAVCNIVINDHVSTERILGKNIWDKLFESKGHLPRIEVLNKDRTQLLRLIFHYGGAKNSVDEFEIIKIDSLYKIPQKAIVLSCRGFVSGKKISLGMNRNEVTKILGVGYKLSSKDGMEQLYYSLDSKSGFVKRYNQFEYYIKCVFKDGVLIKYSFGFVEV